MDIPEEPGALLLTILVTGMFLFLRALQKGSLSERQQCAAWVVLTAMFFLTCNVLLRGGVGRVTAPPVADIRSVGLNK
jgi:hypothetical protein